MEHCAAEVLGCCKRNLVILTGVSKNKIQRELWTAKAQILRYWRGGRDLHKNRLEAIHIVFCQRFWLHSAYVLRTGVKLNSKIIS